MTDDLEHARREAAELLGLDPDKLTPGDRLRCELISALRAAVDDELAKVTSSRSANLGKLIIAVDTLTRFLADAKPRGDETPHIYKQDPYVVMEGIIDRWIAADEDDRREKGLSPRIHDQEEQQARIDELEAELAELRGESVAHARQLPSPERTIDVPDGDIVGPREQSDNPANARAPVGADDPKPPVTIDAKPEGSWTGPQDGPPSWLRPVPPTDPAKRPPASPPVAKSGAEAERQRQRVNSDRSVEHKVMGNPRMAQPDKMPGGFFWGGASGKRAW